MRVFIPSRGRADARVLKGPAAQMPRSVLPTYVVPSEEVRDYYSALTEYGVAARVLGCPVQGIAKVRLWIAMQVRRAREKKFLMLDDDIGILVRRGEDTWQLRQAEPDEVLEMIQWIESQLDTSEHVGISAREGNNNAGVGSKHQLVSFNTRTIRTLGYRTDAFLAVDHLRCEVMEDFDVNLQILERGGSNSISSWWAQGQRMTGEDGGCSLYRDQELQDISARTLAALHPGVVSLRTKENITDRDGFGTRTEVTIQWKQAWLMGQSYLREQERKRLATSTI